MLQKNVHTSAAAAQVGTQVRGLCETAWVRRVYQKNDKKQTCLNKKETIG